MKKLMEMLPVLRSARFWVIVAIGVVEAVQAGGYLADGWADIVLSALEMIGGSAAVVRTVDRFAERVG